MKKLFNTIYLVTTGLFFMSGCSQTSHTQNITTQKSEVTYEKLYEKLPVMSRPYFFEFKDKSKDEMINGMYAIEIGDKIKENLFYNIHYSLITNAAYNIDQIGRSAFPMINTWQILASATKDENLIKTYHIYKDVWEKMNIYKYLDGNLELLDDKLSKIDKKYYKDVFKKYALLKDALALVKDPKPIFDNPDMKSKIENMETTFKSLAIELTENFYNDKHKFYVSSSQLLRVLAKEYDLSYGMDYVLSKGREFAKIIGSKELQNSLKKSEVKMPSFIKVLENELIYADTSDITNMAGIFGELKYIT